ncbi:hypothetical protein F5050DRAFT_1716593, partial [Lentinula boryana]
MSSPYPSVRQRRLYPASGPGPTRSSAHSRIESSHPHLLMASASTPQEGAKAARHFIHTYVDEDDDNEADSPLRRAYHDSIDRRNTSSPSGQLPCIPVPSTGSSTSSSSKRQSCTPVSTIGSETDSEDDDKIPKPLGEVGRPNRGGYTLRVVLKWKDEHYHEIK